MLKKTTVTFKMDKDKKKIFYNFCREQGISASDFFEMAVENEIESRLFEESPDVYFDYDKKKKNAVSYDAVIKELKAKEEMH